MDFIILLPDVVLDIITRIIIVFIGLGFTMWMVNQYDQLAESNSTDDEDIINDVYDGRDEDTDGIDRLRE
jgi:nitrogen fixation-related uncharacterized protein